MFFKRAFLIIPWAGQSLTGELFLMLLCVV